MQNYIQGANDSPRCASSLRKLKGFTLIELVIAIAIVGILTAIAVPSYQSFIRKSNRKAAATCSLEQSQFAERYFTTNLTYVGLPAPAGGCVADLVAANRYVFAFTNVTATTYTVRATPTGDQLNDTDCLILRVLSTGAKQVSGSKPADQCFSR